VIECYINYININLKIEDNTRNLHGESAWDIMDSNIMENIPWKMPNNWNIIMGNPHL
jgi:hypothetical protein